MARPEQTEKPTAKRREEARKRGQVPRSQDLAGACVFLAIVLILRAVYAPVLDGVVGSSTSYFQHVAAHADPTIRSTGLLFAEAGSSAMLLFVLVLGVAYLTGILANVAQFGFLFSVQVLKPNFSKLNPINGFKNIFSKRIFVQLGKQIVKLFFVVVIIYNEISNNIAFFAQVGQTTPSAVLQLVTDIIFAIAWKFGLLLVVVGLLDYIYERWNLEQNLMMTKQEVKDEWKQAEGNPEAKAAMKRRQREGARRRMMQAIPRATVVVTNPTHYAVALEWDEAAMEAPVVTVKGADLVAKRIRDLAREHGIPIMENPPLARTLYDRVELDQAIPPNLYAAVAQVIAFVYKLKRKTIA
jgi:flagellar biosynthetic protein FlhB